MTEQEAKTKWCPFVRASWSGPATECQPAQEGYIGNRDVCGDPALTALNCIGSGCMAWRWYRTHINDPKNPGGDLIPSTDTHGFCGLAGPWHRERS